MPHQEFLQVITHNFGGAAVTAMTLRDIQMPKCSPQEICLIRGVRVSWEMTANNIRWRLLMSQEPNDRFNTIDIDQAYMKDVFYYLSIFRVVNGNSGFDPGKSFDTVWFPYAIPYPFDRLRVGSDSTSAATGRDWIIQVYYTVEQIPKGQITALAIRRGTIRHAREGGPEP